MNRSRKRALYRLIKNRLKITYSGVTGVEICGYCATFGNVLSCTIFSRTGLQRNIRKIKMNLCPECIEHFKGIEETDFHNAKTAAGILSEELHIKFSITA